MVIPEAFQSLLQTFTKQHFPEPAVKLKNVSNVIFASVMFSASSFHFSASQNSQAASFHFLHLYEGEGESRIVSYFFHFFFICFF